MKIFKVFAACFIISQAALPVKANANLPFINESIVAGSVDEFVSVVNSNGNTLPGPVKPILAATPPMGWNSWNWFGRPNITEKIVREVIDVMVKNGLRDAGYNYIVVDGGWRDSQLGPNGELQAEPQRFPSGMKALADYAHAKGFKFGLHTVPGTADCGGNPVGGYNHEEVQMKQFISWGLDFIKLDKCKFADGWNEDLLRKTYLHWAELIKQSGKPIVLSISAYKFREWNPEVGQMSRTTGDITSRVGGGAYFDTKTFKAFRTVMEIAEQNSQSARYARPGYWNDPDMLVTGSQGLSIEQQEIHFALWCIMSAPLFLGDDPRYLSRGEMAIIANKDAIMVDQDPTEQGKRITKDGGGEIWAKKLKNGRVAVLFLNRDAYAEKNITLNLADVGMNGTVKAKNIYTGQYTGSYTKTITQTIKPLTGTFLLL